MFSGFTEGIYDEDQLKIDVKSLANEVNVSYIEDKVIDVNPSKKCVTTTQHGDLSFDVLSFDIGSLLTTQGRELDSSIHMKPTYTFRQVEKLYDVALIYDSC